MYVKNVYSEIFNMGNMKKYNSFIEEYDDIKKIHTFLVKLKENYYSNVITKENVKEEIQVIKTYFLVRNKATGKSFLKNIINKTSINKAETLLLIMALSDAEEDIKTPELYAEVVEFLGEFSDETYEPVRNEKIALLLESGINDYRNSKSKVKVNNIIMHYIQKEGEFACEPLETNFLFAKRFMQSDELDECILNNDIINKMEKIYLNQNSFSVCIKGKKDCGKEYIVKSFAKKIRKNVLIIDGEKLKSIKKDTAIYLTGEYVKNWFYMLISEAVLSDDIICLKNVESVDKNLIAESTDNKLIVIQDTYISVDRNNNVEDEDKINYQMIYEIPIISIEAKEKIWDYFLENKEKADDISGKYLSGKYTMEIGTIKKTIEMAYYNMISENRKKIEKQDIAYAVARLQTGGLGHNAKKVNTKFKWDDLILENDTKKQLEYVCAQVKYRNLVEKEWGLYEKIPYGKGISALFYGPPGTGKTMAAQVLADELGLDLYRVDLSQLISKYIGETQKNISDLFIRASQMNVIIFFDEADSIFAKRMEVKDSNDKNANAEVAHLLAEMENYDGIVFLATNLKDQIDDAFKRRIKYMIPFYFPDVQTRKKLWKSMIPEKMPKSSWLDIDFFADKFEMTGSQIKDVIVQASYMAANDNEILSNEYLKEALTLNFQKYGKMLTSRDFEYLG